MQTTEFTGLLIGYGSIGRRHANALAGKCSRLVIVEPKAAARTMALADHPQAWIAESLDEITNGFSWNSCLPVIASWGPSHADLFRRLVERGAGHILCEKPMASSVRAAEEMVQIAEREKVSLAVNHYIRYSGVARAMEQFSKEHDMGEPASVVVEGGAACLVTNGIHWIDFATELFRSPPKRVVSTARGEPINPRADDLHFYGGSAVWSFDGGREAVITLNNHSSVALTARIYYRNTVVEMDADLNMLIRQRDMKAAEKFPKLTRTGPALEQIFEGRLPGVLSLEERLNAALVDALEKHPRICTAKTAAAAVSSCIGALVSAREGKAIDLPIRSPSPWVEEAWPIS